MRTTATTPDNDIDRRWSRAIVLVDMNAFFASIEQLDNPSLRGRPVAVTNGDQGTCIITCSYEARAFGIHTGMRLPEARRRCPELVRITARSTRYAEISARIMSALEAITPDIEVFSVDEAFLDVTHVQRLHGAPPVIAKMVQRLVREVSGLPCSVGVAGDKTTAKWAAKQRKPEGLTVVPPWETALRLHDVPVTELCGVGRGIGNFLASRGVVTCGDMARLPVSELAQRWGNIGRRIWLMAQGRDPEPIRRDVADPKSVGHGKVLPPATRDPQLLAAYLERMAHKVATRLRRHGLEAQQYFIGLRTDDGWLGGRHLTPRPSDDGHAIAALCRRVLARAWEGQGVHQVQVTALDPVKADCQLELFGEPAEPRRQAVNRAVDRVNRRFGDQALSPASLLGRVPLHDVIAPAWKPDGIRRTV
ncbi:DNA polymerase IV [Acidihalobacter aeolianus]|uniref:DNA polymerase IV n=1 Tax=Acidihalobacter aeolianus TaxID=2792603 RepID=A0A1D8K456_9GAMM|nr:DNA polymerase IV [Acidihalobacter aeolianus]AOV15740.1 DNA polymerase IV [Acidihalobacter aeolianus]